MLYQYGPYSKWVRIYGCISEGLTNINAVLRTARLNSQCSQLSGRIVAGGGSFENLLEAKVIVN